MGKEFPHRTNNNAGCDPATFVAIGDQQGPVAKDIDQARDAAGTEKNPGNGRAAEDTPPVSPATSMRCLR